MADTTSRCRKPIAALVLWGLTVVYLGAGRLLADEPKGVTGIWKQSIYDTKTQLWKSAGWYVVTQGGGSYSMALVDYTFSPGVRSIPIDITQIDVSDDAWNFVENYENESNRVYRELFRLNRAGPDRYEGKIYANDVNDDNERHPPINTCWKRLTSKAQQAKELRSVLNQLKVEKMVCERRIPMLEGFMEDAQRRSDRWFDRDLPGLGVGSGMHAINWLRQLQAARATLQEVNEKIASAEEALIRLEN